MKSTSFLQRLAKWVLVASLLNLGFHAGMAMAQTEPSMKDVYATAQAGRMEEAQLQIQQVLISHPNSAKAYFVQAELYARQGKLDRAQESLAKAQKYAPGLAFAKPEAVQALRAQISGKSAHTGTATPVPPAAPSPTSWALPLLLAGGVMVAGYFFFRRRNASTPVASPMGYANANGLSGPQNFGANGGGYPQQGYPQQGGTGLGGKVMGGLAAGLAVGAGVMAAEAIGRNLMGGQHSASPDHSSQRDSLPIESNPDMGGANFGINDSSSWDDGGGAGGGDWDN